MINLLTTASLPGCSIQYINTGVRKTNMDYGVPEKNTGCRQTSGILRLSSHQTKDGYAGHVLSARMVHGASADR